MPEARIPVPPTEIANLPVEQGRYVDQPVDSANLDPQRPDETQVRFQPR